MLQALTRYIDESAKAKRQFREAVKVGLRRSAIMVSNDVKKSMGGERGFGFRKPSPPGEPPAIQTGTLVRSITNDFTDIDQLVVRVGTNIKYGKYLELGVSKPYTIKPKNGKVLAFKVGGKVIFVRSVRHPGIKPRPYLKPALQRNQGKINAAWADLIDRYKWKL